MTYDKVKHYNISREFSPVTKKKGLEKKKKEKKSRHCSLNAFLSFKKVTP